MTLETSECTGLREGSKAEFEGKGVLDSVAQEDGKRSGECNGIGCPEAEEINEVAKDDVDSSYVFVNGESGELSERDLDVDDKVDLAGNQIVESSVDSDEVLDRDLGADSRVENVISEIDGKRVENGALMPSGGAEVGERSSGSNQSSDQNKEKGGLVVSNGELNHEKGEIGQLILENGDNYKATDTLNSYSEVGKQNIGGEAPVRGVIDGHHVPGPVTEIQNEVSCVAQGCGESFGEIGCNHDGFNREMTVNCEIEGQFDGGSTAATTSEIKESIAKATGTAGSAPSSLVNREETVTSNPEEKIPSAEESEVVVTVAHVSESPQLENKESLASDATEDIPESQQAEIAITERIETEPPPLMNEEKIVTLDSTEEIPAAKQFAQSNVPATEKSEIVVKVTHGSESWPHENEETLTSDAADYIPAAKQADIKATERTGSESMPLMNEEEMLTQGSELLHPNNEKTLASDTADDVPAAEQAETMAIENTGSESMVTSNSTQEISAAEQSAQFRMEQESETQSKVDLRETYLENRETMPICTADNVKSKADKSDAVQQNNEGLPSWHDESLGVGSEASGTVVEIPENSNTCHFDDNELVDEVTTFDDSAKIVLEVGEESAKSREDITASSANDMDSITIIEEVSIEDRLCPSHVYGVEPKPEVVNKSTKGQDSVSACPELETKAEENGDNATTIPDNDTMPVTEDSPLIVGVGKDEGSYDAPDAKSKSKIGSGPMECEESMTDSVEEIHSANKNDPDSLAHAESNAAERGSKDEVLPALIDGASGLSLPGQKVDTDVKPQQFFMIRVPRFSDDKLKIKIQQAQQEVDAKTESRDFIRVAMQKQKVVCTEYWQKVEDARKEERAARDAVASKRQEMESIQSFLNKLKNATSISDIDNRIHNLQHRINHETNTLKEEKILIREMNQLKQNRENLSSSLASEAELQEAFGKREEMETRLQHLKGELDTLRKDMLRAEGNTKRAKTRYDDQCEHLRNLQAQFRAADDLRQEAYTNLRNFKKESYVKNEYFYSYKDDMKVATSFAFSGDREALRCHCSSQVDKIMELWNTHDEFRHQYVKANIPSTVRRFRTLDGRSLGPDEQPAVLHNPTEQKENIFSHVSKNNTPALAIEGEEEKVNAPLSAVKLSSSDGPTLTQKSQPQQPRTVIKPTPKEVVLDKENDKEEEEKETKKTTEEDALAKKAEELAWKEEELRKEKEAAELKEQLRLEQIAKAKEAEERKKRKVEKAQAKAEIRAQKEAELREKRKEKKERKKERKATATNTENACEAEASAPVTEIPSVTVQEQSEKMASISSKQPSRWRAPAKEYNKIKPLPPPLRNRGKRKMQTWMWLLLTAVLVLALFIVGDYVSFPRFSLWNSGF